MNRNQWKAVLIGGPAWVIAAANVVPAIDPLVTPALSTLAIGVGVASALSYVVRDCQRPTSQIWESGREFGRREAIAEGARTDRVVSLDAERQARREFDERRTGSL